MKKLIMDGPRKSILIDVPVPVPGDHQVLVKIKYCGVCMSEHHDWAVASRGRVFGHEPMGVVEKVGKDVTEFKPGDRVTGLGLEAFTEYLLFTPDKLVHVPHNVKDEDATAEPLSCLISAASKVPLTLPGDTVAVVGTGYMGLGMVSLLKLRGAGKVIAVDVREEALENAKRFGATECYLPHQVPKEYLASWSDIWTGGVSIVTEWAGTNESLKLAGEMTKIDGFLGIGAYHTGGNRMVDIQLWNVKAISAVSLHERKDPFQIKCCQHAMELLSSGQWKFTNVNTRIYGLHEFDQAQQDLDVKPGNMIKAIIDCTKW